MTVSVVLLRPGSRARGKMLLSRIPPGAILSDNSGPA